MIIKEEELLKNNLHFVKGKKIHLTGTYIQLDFCANDFIDFCIARGIDTVFYKYEFYIKEDYVITEDCLREHTLNENEYLYCKPWVEKYNDELKELDFSSPKSLLLVANYGDMCIVVSLVEEWLNRSTAENALWEFQDEHEEDLVEFYEDNNIVDEFASVLLADKEFRFCTNKTARAQYLKRFLADKKNKKFLILGKGPQNQFEKMYHIECLVNQIYNEYKNNCRKYCIRLGEKLPEEED